MGAFFALFNSNELSNFELNWNDNINPKKSNEKLYLMGTNLLKNSKKIINDLSNYKGGKNEIKNAMSAQQNSDECFSLTMKALDVVIPNAKLCNEWRLFSVEIAQFLRDKLLPKFSNDLANMDDIGMNNNNNDDDDMKYNDNINDDNKNNTNKDVTELTLVGHQALLKLCADLLDFLLTFDQYKMMEPQIQNDFSFYKRTLNKKKYFENREIVVTLQDAGFLSMFLAQAIPLIKSVSNELSKSQNSVNIMGVYSNACYDLLNAKKFKNDKHRKLALRAMVTSFIIYDHANRHGAFVRQSITKANKIVNMVATEYVSLYNNKDDVSGLDNIIKFASLHFNDANTPQNIKRLL